MSKVQVQNYNNLEILNKEFIFFNSVRFSLQPMRKALACWKSGQPIRCANYIFAPSLADLHMLSQHSSLCSRYFCLLGHSLTYIHLAEQPTQQLVFYISVQNLFNMARTKKTPKNLPAKKKSRSGKRPGQVQQTPWSAKGWTYQQWHNWKKQQQPDSSSCKATINPSWWAGKGMVFKPGGRSLCEIRYFQKHTQLLVRKLPFSR